MNKTITFLSIATVAVIAGAALTMTLTNAAEPSTTDAPQQDMASFRSKGMMKHFRAGQEALDANDFAAFQTAIADSPLAEKITTEAQFQQFKQFQELMKEGKTDEAKAIGDALGLPMVRSMKKHGDPAKMQAVKDAIEANDFTAFQVAITAESDGPFSTIDTAEEFAKLVKMHALMDEAKAIREELGLDMHPRGPKGGMKGFGRHQMPSNEDTLEDDTDEDNLLNK